MGRLLKHEDVSVLDISVVKNFNGEFVRERFEAAAETVVRTLKYVVGDNVRIMIKELD